MRHQVVLAEASRQQVLDALVEANDRLNGHNHESNGGTLQFYFSGHGNDAGELCLADGSLSAEELADCWVRGNTSSRTRHVQLVLDCCHAGMTLAQLYLHPGHGRSYILRDAFAACLPRQEAFELRTLGHSVLTHTMIRADPLEIVGRIKDEGREPTERETKLIKKTLRESTQHLTNGAQHAIDMINGHYISIAGGSRRGVELGDRSWTLTELETALDELRTRGQPNS